MDPYTATLERFAMSHKTSPVELVYTSHPSWPIPETLKARGNHGDRVSLAVLDSSFNPPTNAHLALACLPPLSSRGSDEDTTSRTFDATLLLFSMKNADKTLKPGDATPSQRLHMMVLLARELQKQPADRSSRNIAVAVCQEPTFVGKSVVLKPFLHERILALSSSAHVQLTFLIGFDTLERLFAPRYYGSETLMKGALGRFLSMSRDGSRVICARRTSGASYSQVNTTNVLEAAAGYIDSGAVALADIDEEVRTLSSSEVRGKIGKASDEWQRKVPGLVAAYINENSLYAQFD